ncbi:MAG: type IVB secretion system protein IcmH/DotU [Burkholderiales bacterium]|nr:type IVB secretion system protein IcmH/DotU [Burkholderiales bacterium]
MSDPNFPGAPPSDDPDATMMIPKPGGRRAAMPAPSAGQAMTLDPSAVLSEVEDGGAPVGMNPLVANASVLLNTVPTIRRTMNHPDPAGLREYLLRAITEFEQRARAAGASPEHVLISRYALCTMIDEAVANMPWGASPEWVQQSLLVTLHREGFGGEKFFQLLEKAMEDPRRNIDLLELMYVCIALGFQGRYSVIENGRQQLDALRDRLHNVIRRERGEFERDLSGKWKGVQRVAKPLVRRLSVWLVLAAVALLLFVLYLVFALLLASKSDPVFNTLAAIHSDVGDLKRAPPPPPPPAAPRLKPLLLNEILAGQVDVDEDAVSSHVIIHGDKFYDPGSAEIKADLVPVINRIAQAINQVPGVVTVSGHTDNQPTKRSLRFPSNYELSLERARGVATLLGQTVRNHTIKAEGLADSKPIAPNTTPDGRARNRRVEITLRTGA